MSHNTKEDIIRRAKEDQIEFIRLQFTDMFGALKNVAITVSQLEKALDNKCMFDGSSIDGFVRIEESDMYLYPDPDTYEILSWLPQEEKVARLICDVYKADGTPFEGDPRYVLRRAIEKASAMGYKFNVGPELEFFLFHTDEYGRPTTNSHEKAGYFDISPLDLGEEARRDMVLTLEDMGFEIEASHHECAPAQHEIDFKYGPALATADNIMTFKLIVKQMAKKHGLFASFMPKPIYGIAGSGMHTNMSLTKDGKNIFDDPNGVDGLSTEAYQFIAGVMAHIKGITAVANPLVNSYKRLVPGHEAPVYIAWSATNRSPLIRIPAARGAGTRIELRSPDPSANPYLLFALCLAAGLDGIEKKMDPPKEIRSNIFELSPIEMEENEIEQLPTNLSRAVTEMKADPFIREVLGEHVFKTYVKAKRTEWETYRMQVTQWEIDEYLYKI